MKMLTISLIIISVNTLITTLIFKYFTEQILELFKDENEFDKSVIKAFRSLTNLLNITFKVSKNNNTNKKEMNKNGNKKM